MNLAYVLISIDIKDPPDTRMLQIRACKNSPQLFLDGVVDILTGKLQLYRSILHDRGP